MKKLLTLLVALCLLLGISASADLPTDWNVEATPDLYADVIDLSEHVVLDLMLVGDQPTEWEMVQGAINEELAPFNTEINGFFVSWSDYQTVYPLTLTGGDGVDFCFTATWCHFINEAKKESFYVLTEDFINTYMPLTAQYQAADSWSHVSYAGKIQGVGQNAIRGTSSGTMMFPGIRDDLRKAYGIESMATIDDYVSFLLAVAADTEKTGIFGYSAYDLDASFYILWAQEAGYFSAYNDFTYIYEYGEVPAPEDMELFWMTDTFHDYLATAKMLSDAGVWSRSCLSNTTTAAQSFVNGTSASFVWNCTAYSYFSMAKESLPDIECAAYIINPNAWYRTENYSQNIMAIAASSDQVERSAMVIDLLKFDTSINNMCLMGIEGYHWVDNGDGSYSSLDASVGYQTLGNALSWGTKNGNWNEVYIDPAEGDMINGQLIPREVVNPVGGFVFNSDEVRAQESAVDAVIKSYRQVLEFGMFDDPEVAWSEYVDEMTTAGCETYLDAYRTQYADWLAVTDFS